MSWVLFPGADNYFELYEDDDHLAHSIVPVSGRWSPQKWAVTVGVAEGETAHLPRSRSYVALFRGLAAGAAVTATRNGQTVDVISSYDEQTRTLKVTAGSISPNDSLAISLTTEAESLMTAGVSVLEACKKLVSAFRMESWTKRTLYEQLPELVEDPAPLAHYSLSLTSSQMRALLETITGAGVLQGPTRRNDDQEILFWNNAQTDLVRFKLVATDLDKRPVIRHEVLPAFSILTIGEQEMSLHMGNGPADRLAEESDRFLANKYVLEVTYLDILTLSLGER